MMNNLMNEMISAIDIPDLNQITLNDFCMILSIYLRYFQFGSCFDLSVKELLGAVKKLDNLKNKKNTTTNCSSQRRAADRCV